MFVRAFSFAILLATVTMLPALAVAPEGGAVMATWARTDLPVAEGLAARTWMWGPEAFTPAMVEPYAEGVGGLRPVQYFDKARMEITDPAAAPTSPWYVTNGLLVVELISGQMQAGHGEFEQREPAPINVAGDPDAAGAPTYATLTSLLDEPAHEAGVTITATVDGDGNIGSDPSLAAHGVSAAELAPETGHAVASVFWEFMNSEGLIYKDGEYVTGPLFPSSFYATGLPVSEAYWAEAPVAGTVKWVLIQAFERRVLTYTPDNPAGWQVEAGNVGRHYYQWRYESLEDDPDDGEGGPIPLPEDPGPAPESLTIEVSGLEISAGETIGDATHGARFVGVTDGDLVGSMDVSIDYTPPGPGPNVVHTIVSGSWSLEASDGALAGEVTSGSAVWDSAGEIAAVSATFTITSAEGAFAGLQGAGEFTGTLSHLSFPPRITGTLVFE